MADETALKKRCAACGSERIIPMASLGNRQPWGLGDGYVLAASEPALVIHTNPRAALIPAKQTVFGRVHAWVCGECGYMPLFADNPAELYAAYEQFLRATRE